ncbi:M48 family metalloprotease [Haloarchaeobius litoreus]|uniref:M48 family metalloprotease n=1 Tax=Haloarchaeobius litoreus TaxID=755306 RepID=A0ABD6DHS2_9EURY|nr:M48 family metalloprotease [Haloarchaeobius litoreus]
MERDPDLTWRILLALLTILVVDVVLVAAAAYLVAPWLAPLRVAVADAVGLSGTSPLVWGAVVVLPVSLAFGWAQLRYSRRGLLDEVDAPLESGDEYPDVQGRLQRLAVGAGMATPSLAVAQTDVPNSFAVGGVTDDTVVVSTGLLDALVEDELDAVLAHELTHLRNRDAFVLTLASFVPALISDDFSPFGSRTTSTAVWVGLVGLAYFLCAPFLAATPFTLGYTVSFVFALLVTVVLGGIFLGIAGAVVLGLSQHLSTYREYVADRSGAMLAGQPAAMATALRTLDRSVETPTADKRSRYAGVAGLCFLPHGFSTDDEPADEGQFTVETRSHPGTEQRIARLQQLEREEF